MRATGRLRQYVVTQSWNCKLSFAPHRILDYQIKAIVN
jgi:hypothetical protein